MSKGGGRALGAAISKIHSFKEIRFKTFESLFHSCVTPVLDYCSGVWGFEKFSCVDNVQNRALRAIGLHRLTPIKSVLTVSCIMYSQF